jgi:hypothetical protein
MAQSTGQNTERSAGRSTEKDWRALCAAASEEPDTEKLLALVHQILRAFDESDQKRMSPPGAFAPKS